MVPEGGNRGVGLAARLAGVLQEVRLYVPAELADAGRLQAAYRTEKAVLLQLEWLHADLVVRIDVLPVHLLQVHGDLCDGVEALRADATPQVGAVDLDIALRAVHESHAQFERLVFDLHVLSVLRGVIVTLAAVHAHHGVLRESERVRCGKFHDYLGVSPRDEIRIEV